MVETGGGKGQVGHRRKMRLDGQALRHSGGGDGRNRGFGSVERGHLMPHGRQGQRVPPDPGTKVQDAAAGGQGGGMFHHPGLGLGPRAGLVRRLPFGVPLAVRGIGCHISFRLIQPEPCSTATTSASIIRMIASASS